MNIIDRMTAAYEASKPTGDKFTLGKAAYASFEAVASSTATVTYPGTGFVVPHFNGAPVLFVADLDADDVLFI
jgi:hypothetical protein